MPIIPYANSKWSFWLMHFNSMVEKPGVRHANKFDVTIEEWKNLFRKNCFCGKLRKNFDQYQRRYCTAKHGALWQEKTLDWNSFRYRIVKRDNFHCTQCGLKLRTIRGPYSYEETVYEVDHIVAIIFGGMCFDESNVRTLCGKCHKIKTKSDMAILAFWKQSCKYDIGPILREDQSIMEDFTNC